ncbi:MAG: OB-fold nucleic acid binding domain-containing protein [Aigarchaeota archaeon]|nr:OB-fold nucleic acid binding domain-containing protein [Aigarchaeota archaeon]MCX8193350.1 OB-fold nucleic acid binding domain-containing protein [Nitrososphaeria archaeon]MDW7985880.1 OB-fold nucleic acid binding domain-containing protein [Nitrososphaerota archaeon]
MVENLVKVGDLTPRSRGVNLVGKIVSKTPERIVKSQYDQTEHRLSEALIADETGAISLVLWDDRVDQVNEGDVVKIVNGFIKLFRGKMQLNLGRFGSIEASSIELTEVNTENNLSERAVRYSERYPKSSRTPRFKRTRS